MCVNSPVLKSSAVPHFDYGHTILIHILFIIFLSIISIKFNSCLFNFKLPPKGVVSLRGEGGRSILL